MGRSPNPCVAFQPGDVPVAVAVAVAVAVTNEAMVVARDGMEVGSSEGGNVVDVDGSRSDIVGLSPGVWVDWMDRWYGWLCAIARDGGEQLSRDLIERDWLDDVTLSSHPPILPSTHPTTYPSTLPTPTQPWRPPAKANANATTPSYHSTNASSGTSRIHRKMISSLSRKGWV
jgi:hypothetical protein